MTPPATAALGGARAAQRARSGLRPPRRVSGPARRPKAPPSRRPALARAGSPLLQLLAAAERLAGHRLIDRLVRGRAWLILITCALIGVVTLQLALLKLNGGVGRTVQTQAQLQRENASLSIENSELAAADRVQTRAAQLGMEFASSTALRSLSANSHVDFSRAASVLGAPVHSQTPGSEAGHAQSTGGEAASAQSQSNAGSSAQSASTAESKPAGEASSQSSSGAEASTGSTATSAQGGEAPATSQSGASESETAAGSAGGQGAPESGSSG
jgi:cell division protein FtsL